MADVRVRWIDAPSPSIGSKIFRNDIEITNIGLGVQEYIDTNAPDDATPKYDIQSYDADGNETTQEVEGRNMGYIDTSVVPTGTDIYPQDNAVSLTGETTSIVPWDNSINVAQELAGVDQADTTAADSGNYCIKTTCEATGNSRLQTDGGTFNIVNGKTYDIFFKIKGAIGGEPFWYRAEDWPAPGTDITVDVGDTCTTDWVEYSMLDILATADHSTAVLKIWNGDTIGNEIYLDSVRVIEKD